MSIHISCDMYLRLGLYVQIRLYNVLPYKAKISAKHGIGFILDRCIVYLGLTMPNLQKKRLLIFEIFNIKKCTLFFLEPSIYAGWSCDTVSFVAETCYVTKVNETRFVPLTTEKNGGIRKKIGVQKRRTTRIY